MGGVKDRIHFYLRKDNCLCAFKFLTRENSPCLLVADDALSH